MRDFAVAMSTPLAKAPLPESSTIGFGLATRDPRHGEHSSTEGTFDRSSIWHPADIEGKFDGLLPVSDLFIRRCEVSIFDVNQSLLKWDEMNKAKLWLKSEYYYHVLEWKVRNTTELGKQKLCVLLQCPRWDHIPVKDDEYVQRRCFDKTEWTTRVPMFNIVIHPRLKPHNGFGEYGIEDRRMCLILVERPGFERGIAGRSKRESGFEEDKVLHKNSSSECFRICSELIVKCS